MIALQYPELIQEFLQIPWPDDCTGTVRRFHPKRVLLLEFPGDGEAFPVAFLAPDLFRLNFVPGFLAAVGLEFFNKHPPGKETIEPLAALPATPDSHAGGPVNQHHPAPFDQGFLDLVFRAADRLHACGQRTGLLIRHRKQRHTQVNHKSAIRAKWF
jgi:hypothetical protein